MAERPTATDLTPDELRRLAEPLAPPLAAHWGANAPPVRVRVVDNAVYRFDCPAGPSILRLTHDSHRSAAELTAELAWVERLAAAGVAVAAPRPTATGAWWVEAPAATGVIRAAVFAFADGVPLSPGSERWEPRTLEAWGRLFAQLHASARSLPSAIGQARGHWQEDRLWRALGTWLGPTRWGAEWTQARAWLLGLPQDAAHVGLIHQDLTFGNLVAHAAGVTAFDFDDCLVHAFAFDIAVALHLVLMDLPSPAAVAAGAQAFLTPLRAGYCSVASWPAVWDAWLPSLVRIRDLQALAWCRSRGLAETPGTYHARLAGQLALPDRYAPLGPLAWAVR